MTKRTLSRTLGLAIALATLAGCGQGTLPTTTTDMLNGASALRAKGDAQGQKPGFAGPEQGPMAMYAALDLSEDQKTQLKAIADKYKPAAPAEPVKVERPQGESELQAILTAETVDVEALKAALAARPAAPAKPEDHRLAILVETRAVLTEAQIAQVVAQLEAGPAQRAERPARPEQGEAVSADRPERGQRPMQARPATGAEGGFAPRVQPGENAKGQRTESRPAQRPELGQKAELNLSAEQQAAFDAFRAKLAPAPQAEPAKDAHEAERAAMIAFWKTGDTAALEAAKPPVVEAPAFPVDELVALVTSLSAEQRQQLFNHGVGFGLIGGHPMGPEDRGGMRGHGGPRGGEGDRRPAPSLEAEAEATAAL